MTLAHVSEIRRYIGTCQEHPHWATPTYSARVRVEELVREHNEAEHQGTETL